MITYSETFLEFLRNSTCKIAKILYRAYYQQYPAYRFMLTTEQVNFLTFLEAGTIGYLPYNREMVFNDDGQWAMEGRQSGKAAKVIRKVFKKKALALFTDVDFENVSNAYKASFCGSLSFKLLNNKKIPSVYEMERGVGGGTLSESCMNDEGHLMEIYQHCACLKILILKGKDGLLYGRALVWSLENDITLMDRIYVIDDFMYDLFISHANSKGWWHKKYYNSAEYKDEFVDETGREVMKKFTVYTNTDFWAYPYIDTFCYGEDGALCNFDVHKHHYCKIQGIRITQYWDQLRECQIVDLFAVTIERGVHQGRLTHVDNTITVDGEIWWRHDPAVSSVRMETPQLEDYPL